MTIDDTTRRMAEDPAEGIAFLLDGMATGGAERFITDQEKRGQRQLVHSDRLPSDLKGDRAEWEALGFTFGEPDEEDPVFMPATLPDGWKRQPTEHSMWSVIADQLGRERVAIFYKAAFYDRSAFARLTSVYEHVHKHVENGAPMVISDEWATRDAVLAAMRQHAAENRDSAARFREYAASDTRSEDNRKGCMEIAERHDATTAKYEAAIAELQAR